MGLFRSSKKPTSSPPPGSPTLTARGSTTSRRPTHPAPPPSSMKQTPSLPDLLDNYSGHGSLSIPAAYVDASVSSQTRFVPSPTTPGAGPGNHLHHRGSASPASSSTAKASSSGGPGGGGISSRMGSFQMPFRGILVGSSGEGRPPTAGPSAGGATSGAAPPSSFSAPRVSIGPRASKRSLRKKQLPTSFNVAIVGGEASGKSSLLKLVLQTLELAPTTELPVDISKLGSAAYASEHAHQAGNRSFKVEVFSPVEENRREKIVLTVVDTPGLEFEPGRELELDRAVSALMREIESRLDETLMEESKIHRTGSRGDDHIHLVLYLIDASSVLATARKPIGGRVAMSLGVFHPPPLLETTAVLSAATGAAALKLPDSFSEPLTPLASPVLGVSSSPDSPPSPPSSSPATATPTMQLPPSQIKALTRLSTRANVLPLLTKSDQLTKRQLGLVRAVVRRDLQKAGLDPGGDLLQLDAEGEEEDFDEEGGAPGRRLRSAPLSELLAPPTDPMDGSSKVIRLRRNRSRSQGQELDDAELGASSRRASVSQEESDEAAAAAVVAAASARKGSELPFALVGPEEEEEEEEEEEGKDKSGKRLVREYPWGTLDVVDPAHTDFLPFQQAIFTSLPHLKRQTREVVFERFRTERLLIRRSTHAISDEESRRILQD